MAVVFLGPDIIEIDGVAAGGVLDVINNHTSRLPEVLVAFGILLQPWNKRWIDGTRFVARFTPQQTRAIYTSADETLVAARQLLDTYIESNYAVVLDDVQVIGVIEYMVSIGIMTQSESVSILSDSSSLERYIGINVIPEPSVPD